MPPCIRATGIAALLISLELFIPKIVDAKVTINLPNNISLEQVFLTANIAPTELSTSIFNPPDKGGPKRSRSSGTR
ncbi:MAG TPA: hypothetical protein DDZ80_01860 [Cyanobacteria bacterium UBA8803]|nr:hypothetical protein [Cyanobacteria bacterium UBA9273]HBL57340.1 hypothetical protein [Cyanobacteria bacterium UBA8803]